MDPGRIVILNGPPRSGKSSIAAVIQTTFDGVWMNLGVDVFANHVTPEKARPGIGLRPGEADHPASALVPSMYAALYDSIAAHALAGLDVVVDVGHYDRDMAADSARRLDGLAVLFVGVTCPIEELMRRRKATWQQGEEVRPYVERWQREILKDVYDLEVDTSRLSPEQSAQLIWDHLGRSGTGTTAFQRLASAAG